MQKQRRYNIATSLSQLCVWKLQKKIDGVDIGFEAMRAANAAMRVLTQDDVDDLRRRLQPEQVFSRAQPC